MLSTLLVLLQLVLQCSVIDQVLEVLELFAHEHVWTLYTYIIANYAQVSRTFPTHAFLDAHAVMPLHSLVGANNKCLYWRTFPLCCLFAGVIGGYHQVCVILSSCMCILTCRYKLEPSLDAFEQLHARVILRWIYCIYRVCSIRRTSGDVLRTFILSDLTSSYYRVGVVCACCIYSVCFHLLYCLVKTLALRLRCKMWELFRMGADDNSPYRYSAYKST